MFFSWVFTKYPIHITLVIRSGSFIISALTNVPAKMIFIARIIAAFFMNIKIRLKNEKIENINQSDRNNNLRVCVHVYGFQIWQGIQLYRVP